MLRYLNEDQVSAEMLRPPRTYAMMPVAYNNQFMSAGMVQQHPYGFYISAGGGGEWQNEGAGSYWGSVHPGPAPNQPQTANEDAEARQIVEHLTSYNAILRRILNNASIAPYYSRLRELRNILLEKYPMEYGV